MSLRNNFTSGLNIRPILHGDTWEVKGNVIEGDYYKKVSGIVLNERFYVDKYEYYEIDGKVELLFDCTSVYGVMWFFPN